MFLAWLPTSTLILFHLLGWCSYYILSTQGNREQHIALTLNFFLCWVLSEVGNQLLGAIALPAGPECRLAFVSSRDRMYTVYSPVRGFPVLCALWLKDSFCDSAGICKNTQAETKYCFVTSLRNRSVINKIVNTKKIYIYKKIVTILSWLCW